MRYSLFIIVICLVSCGQEIVYPPGGFDYPNDNSLSDSSYYTYPYRDSLNSMDSVIMCEEGKILLAKFNEPNLSIRPQKETVFRLLFESGKPENVFIILTSSKLIVKRRISGHTYPYYNEEKLTEEEKQQLLRTVWYYDHQTKIDTNIKWKRYADSLLKIYPEMTDMKFYKSLRDKMVTYDEHKFQYVEKSIPLKKGEFEYFVTLINKSGFWSMPKESHCRNIPTDADGFALEANTPLKYKIVHSACCDDDERAFTIACQELVKRTGLGKEIHLTYFGEPKPKIVPVITDSNIELVKILDSSKFEMKKH